MAIRAGYGIACRDQDGRLPYLGVGSSAPGLLPVVSSPRLILSPSGECGASRCVVPSLAPKGVTGTVGGGAASPDFFELL